MASAADSISVWRFGTLEAAEVALARLEPVVREGAVEVDGAALVTWPEGHTKPSLRDLGGVAGPGVLWGGFWGVLLALVFLVPLAGPTFGAAAGAFAGGLADFGVADDFVKRVRESVTPGTSALFIIEGRDSLDRTAAAFDGLDVEMIRSDLSYEQTQHLREALGDESAVRTSE
jgi:uncharacterized membrane protein